MQNSPLETRRQEFRNTLKSYYNFGELATATDRVLAQKEGEVNGYLNTFSWQNLDKLLRYPHDAHGEHLWSQELVDVLYHMPPASVEHLRSITAFKELLPSPKKFADSFHLYGNGYAMTGLFIYIGERMPELVSSCPEQWINYFIESMVPVTQPETLFARSSVLGCESCWTTARLFQHVEGLKILWSVGAGLRDASRVQWYWTRLIEAQVIVLDEETHRSIGELLMSRGLQEGRTPVWEAMYHAWTQADQPGTPVPQNYIEALNERIPVKVDELLGSTPQVAEGKDSPGLFRG